MFVKPQSPHFLWWKSHGVKFVLHLVSADIQGVWGGKTKLAQLLGCLVWGTGSFTLYVALFRVLLLVHRAWAIFICFLKRTYTKHKGGSYLLSVTKASSSRPETLNSPSWERQTVKEEMTRAQTC